MPGQKIGRWLILNKMKIQGQKLDLHETRKARAVKRMDNKQFIAREDGQSPPLRRSR